MDTAPHPTPKQPLWNRLTTRLPRNRRPTPAPAANQHPPTGTDAGGGWLIRVAAIAVLLLVGGGAGYVSYHHFYGLARLLGEPHDMAILYPAMSDGVIVMASLVMVHCSRRGIPVPVGAWAALMLGCTVTLIANVAHGWSGGLGSRLLSALAPVAFAAAFELLMWLVRTGRRTAESAAPKVVERVVYQTVEVPVEVVREVVQVERVLPRDRYEAAAWEYEDSLAEGARRAGRRTLATKWGISEREAEQIQKEARTQQDIEQSEDAAPEPPAAPAAPEGNTAERDRCEDDDDDFSGVLSGRTIGRAEFLRSGVLVPVNGHGPAGGA